MSRPGNVEGGREPFDPLTRLADVLISGRLPAGVAGVVIVSTGLEVGVAFDGFDGPAGIVELVETLVETAQAVADRNGIPMMVTRASPN